SPQQTIQERSVCDGIPGALAHIPRYRCDNLCHPFVVYSALWEDDDSLVPYESITFRSRRRPLSYHLASPFPGWEQAESVFGECSFASGQYCSSCGVADQECAADYRGGDGSVV